jgi:hypothetical protein
MSEITLNTLLIAFEWTEIAQPVKKLITTSTRVRFPAEAGGCVYTAAYKEAMLFAVQACYDITTTKTAVISTMNSVTRLHRLTTSMPSLL